VEAVLDAICHTIRGLWMAHAYQWATVEAATSQTGLDAIMVAN
jgi:hypothetical protein